jgi:peptide/nickel transport system substrate-binding protein
MMLEFGSIAPKKVIEAVGIEAFGAHPVGTGPYMFKSWDHGHKITLVRNPNYWDKQVGKIETLEYLIAPEETWFDMIKDGKADLAPNLSGRFAKRLMEEGKGQARILKRKVLISYWFMLKNTGPLANQKVREALNEAVNRKDMVTYADFGNASPLGSLGKSGEFGASPKEPKFTEDLVHAKQLMKEAGFENGFKMKVLVADVAKGVANVMKANLQKIGVTLDLEVVPRTVWTEKVVVYKVLNGGKLPDYDGAINMVDNPTYNLSFHGFIFLHSHGPFSLLNAPEFDKKLEYAISAPNPEEHRRRQEEMDEFIHDQALMLFTTQRILTVAMNPDLDLKKFNLSGHLGRYVLSTASWSKEAPREASGAAGKGAQK